ncbi:hypothetical protein CDAR_419271 [Caerostris darwini]|uniref:Uncharacterized protein n=1 Tax=Caerostris darwini TaxID=1538125 RepID=A0AAV4TLA1_9ARAC|nr:hypothetical protein CDAR_419271 [Caerostris darwini]
MADCRPFRVSSLWYDIQPTGSASRRLCKTGPRVTTSSANLFLCFTASHNRMDTPSHFRLVIISGTEKKTVSATIVRRRLYEGNLYRQPVLWIVLNNLKLS